MTQVRIRYRDIVEERAHAIFNARCEFSGRKRAALVTTQPTVIGQSGSAIVGINERVVKSAVNRQMRGCGPLTKNR